MSRRNLTAAEKPSKNKLKIFDTYIHGDYETNSCNSWFSWQKVHARNIMCYCVSKPNGTSSVEAARIAVLRHVGRNRFSYQLDRLKNRRRVPIARYKRRFRIIFNVIRSDPRLQAEVRSLHVHVSVRVSQRSINFLIELEAGAPFAVAFYSAIKQVLRCANLKVL